MKLPKINKIKTVKILLILSIILIAIGVFLFLFVAKRILSGDEGNDLFVISMLLFTGGGIFLFRISQY